MSGNAESSAAGDKSPLADPSKWVERYGDFLFSYAMMHLRNDAIAEELVQDTFVSALGSVQNFKGLSTERSWLVAILKHKIIDYIRRVGRERKYFEDVENDAEAAAAFNEIGHWSVEPGAWAGNPADAFEQKAFFSQLNDCISRLPEQQSKVFVLRELSELSTDELCKALNVTTTNLWVLLHRARLRLRQCLESNWFEVNKDKSPG